MMNKAKGAGDGNVVAFPGRMAQGKGVIADRAARLIDRDGVVELLNSIVPVPAGFAELLNIPERMYIVERGPSLSSDPSRDAGRVVASLVFHTPFPQKTPDFGIVISSRGSSVFCTLVDRSRKIIVMDSISSLYSEKGSWSSFKASVADALDAKRRLEASGAKFDFLVNSENSINTVRIGD